MQFSRHLGLGLLAAFCCAAVAGSAQERAPDAVQTAPPTVLVNPVTANVTVTDQQLLNANKDTDNWLLHGRTYDNASFSPLTQINAGNVARLAPVAIIHTGMVNTYENTPIEVNGVLFTVTASDHVQTYDAVTGKLLWTYTPKLDYSDVCCGPQARGVAVAYGHVFMAQLDGRVVALDAKTGQVVWRTNQADMLPEPTHYYSFTMAPQVYDGMVIVGNSGAEYPTRGFVEALDATTGKLVWRFRTTAAPDEPGGNSWSGDSWKAGGGSVWNTPAIDPKNGLVVFAAANPNPDYWGENRKGDNLYTNSIIGVHAKTGKIAWYYQQVPHDLWDYDATAPAALFDARDSSGKLVPAAAEAGKVGNVFIVNRLTGALLHKSEPFVMQSANMFDIPGEAPITRYPGINGGSLWSTPSVSPLTHYFYVMGVNQAYSVTAFEMKPYVFGTPTVGQQTGGSQKPEVTPFPPTGTLTAINVDTGKIAWQQKTSLPMYGGIVTTASNLLFTGEMDGDFDAFDAKTGKKLWHYPMGVGVCSPPITYRVKGVQYVAVGASGCARGREYLDKTGLPQFADNLVIFALAGAGK
ncbi:MAG TPA: PQQ-binding-like beta-propeller repeat protein [Rhizomicrobium sp.]|nr:PQQ-binding-like beta-propeller repeat protein [Rhizomicrobium sp.]